MKKVQLSKSLGFTTPAAENVERIEAFQAAIAKMVRPGDAVLDLTEANGEIADLVLQSGAESIVSVDVLNCCSHHFARAKPFDVIVLDISASNMVGGGHIAAVNNLHKQNLIGRNTVIISSKLDILAALSHIDYSLNKRLVTESIPVSVLEFSTPCPEAFNVRVNFKVLEQCVINSLHLSSKTYLAPGVTLDDTRTFNSSIIVPVPEYRASKGEIMSMQLGYVLGGGYKTLSVELLSSPYRIDNTQPRMVA